MGQAYIISILASLVVSITLTPVMAYFLLPSLKRLDAHESPLVRFLKRANRAALKRALAGQRLVLGIVALLVVLAASSAFYLPQAFLPPFWQRLGA